MHVFHHRHLPHAVAIAATGATLAAVLTLLLAGTLNDVWSISPSGPMAATPATVHSSSTLSGWNMSPFRRLFRFHVKVARPAGF